MGETGTAQTRAVILSIVCVCVEGGVFLENIARGNVYSYPNVPDRHVHGRGSLWSPRQNGNCSTYFMRSPGSQGDQQGSCYSREGIHGEGLRRVMVRLGITRGFQPADASVAERNIATLVGGGHKQALLCWMLLSAFSILLGLWRWWERDGAEVPLPEPPRKFWPSLLTPPSKRMAPQSRPLSSVCSWSTIPER